MQGETENVWRLCLLTLTFISWGFHTVGVPGTVFTEPTCTYRVLTHYCFSKFVTCTCGVLILYCFFSKFVTCTYGVLILYCFFSKFVTCTYGVLILYCFFSKFVTCTYGVLILYCFFSKFVTCTYGVLILYCNISPLPSVLTFCIPAAVCSLFLIIFYFTFFKASGQSGVWSFYVLNSTLSLIATQILSKNFSM